MRGGDLGFEMGVCFGGGFSVVLRFGSWIYFCGGSRCWGGVVRCLTFLSGIGRDIRVEKHNWCEDILIKLGLDRCMGEGVFLNQFVLVREVIITLFPKVEKGFFGGIGMGLIWASLVFVKSRGLSGASWFLGIIGTLVVGVEGWVWNVGRNVDTFAKRAACVD